MESFTVTPIGYLRSELKTTAEAPLFYTEGAPDAWLDVLPAYADALLRLQPGDQLIVITWLHEAQRDRLQVHTRGDPNNPLTGVFLTRSPDRPNPLGLHRVTLRAIDGLHLRLGPIEAIDGTPVVDLKPAVPEANDA